MRSTKQLWEAKKAEQQQVAQEAGQLGGTLVELANNVAAATAERELVAAYLEEQQQLKAKLEEISRELLSNPVMENFHLDLRAGG